jgi:3-hydroxyacyl-[acyl-carrier-protein] dehydratase
MFCKAVKNGHNPFRTLGLRQIGLTIRAAVVDRYPSGYTRGLDFLPTKPHLAQADHPLAMRFTLIDRIVELEPCVRITAVKTLTMTEEYLADHFPHFPVMPGVLMLEALTQAGAWLVRVSEDFAHSIVVLKQANNVKYAQFVEPGQTLTVTAEVLKFEEGEVKLKAYGTMSGRIILTARLSLACYNLADSNPAYLRSDEATRQDMRNQFAILHQPQMETAAASSS